MASFSRPIASCTPGYPTSLPMPASCTSLTWCLGTPTASMFPSCRWLLPVPCDCQFSHAFLVIVLRRIPSHIMQLRTFDVNGSTIGLFTCKDMCIHPTRSVRFILIDSSQPAAFITTPKHHCSPLVFGSSRPLPILNKPARIQSS